MKSIFPHHSLSVTCIRGLSFTILALLMCNTAGSSRIARAIMMSMSPKRNAECSEGTITERNLTSSVILSGTVSTCDPGRAGSYRCTLQVWRVMKGKRSVTDLVRARSGTSSSFYKKKYVDVYGLGNILYCDSQVEDHDTRIFFLNKVNDRLILSASLLRITLSNLENTQAVIEGRHIVEKPKKPRDPCLDILCGYGAHCESRNGTASCICPSLSCGSPDDGESDLFAPVCGSDGVTYPNECRLKGAQCMAQRRLRVVSEKACAPIVDTSSCRDVTCGNSAVCEIKVGSDGSRTPTCECETCDNVETDPVCGSDQRSHRSTCDMRRMACMEGRDITVVRRSSCNPCESFNSSSGQFEKPCAGPCSLNSDGVPVCCDDVTCDESPPDGVCGSDGNTYETRCALKRHACMTARDIRTLENGPCPAKKPMTEVSGSISIQSDDACPGGCDPGSSRFDKFVKKLESSINKILKMQNDDDIDGKMLGDFKVVEVRTGSVVLVYTAYASTSSQPISIDEDPDERTAWIYKRLYDPDDGAITTVLFDEYLSTVEERNPADDFVVQDVCFDLQCEYGAVCSVSASFTPSCSCDGIGDADRMGVTHACKRASDGNATGAKSSFINANEVRREMCSRRSFFTFKDVCSEPPSNPCDGGCSSEGEVCIVTNGVGACECVTCGNHYRPVCSNDGQTFRSACKLQRHNCVTGGNLIKISDSPCESQCNDVKCWDGEQCEPEAQGTVCACPTDCVDTYAPVCGSNCVTYKNKCKLVVDACETKINITVAHAGTCDSEEYCRDGSGEEGSGEGDECGCKYGATCEQTIDDEDAKCVCSLTCAASRPGEMVCGSDGITYMNECEVRKAQCEKQQVILVVGKGSCEVACSSSRYGCCADGTTPAKGLRKAGCPEKCHCNEHGSFGPTCYPTSGQCVCKPGVGGARCDRCKPGFWNFRSLAEGHKTGCMACRCHSDGSRREDCDQMTGKCACKAGVTGPKCTKCESDGSWVTSALCDIANSAGSSSCRDVSCRAGQDCVEDELNGSFTCKCPDLSSCDDFNGRSVCGTDGITYPDACQMRVMTCRQGLDVGVAAEGSCRDFVLPLEETPTVGPAPKTTTQGTEIITVKPTVVSSTIRDNAPKPEPETKPEPEPSNSLKPEPETYPEPTVDVSITPKPNPGTFPEPMPETKPEPVTTPTPTTSPEPPIETTPRPKPVPEDENESSGEGCLLGDDEDCMSSGDGESTTSAPRGVDESETVETTSIMTTQSLETTAALIKKEAVIFKGRGIFMDLNGIALPYAAELKDPESELFRQYSDLVQEKILEYVTNPMINQQVKAISVTDFTEYSKWYFTNDGVYVDFDIHLAPGSMGDDVERALNAISGQEHQFSLTGPPDLDDMFLRDRPYSPHFDEPGVEWLQFDAHAQKEPLSSTTTDPEEADSNEDDVSSYTEDVETTENDGKWHIPQFSGASYAVLPASNYFSSITIRMTFRTFDPEGLLVFASQAQSNSDFVSLSIKNSRVEFRFNTGSGPLVLRSKVLVNDSRYHQVVARRNRREGMLKIDGRSAIHGASPRGTSGLNINTNLFVGDVDLMNRGRVRNQVEVTKGLTGCIKDLFVQERNLTFNASCENCVSKHRLAKCGASPCNPNPCKNMGHCLITKQEEEFTNKCICKKRFIGDQCERQAEDAAGPCAVHECHEDSTCIPAPGGDGYTCQCPPGRSGSLCRDEELLNDESFMPAFVQDSYLELDSLKDVKSGMSVEVVFYAIERNGLIFYDSQRKSGEGDFVALNIRDGHLEFLYDLGNGMARIRYPTPITLNAWHTVWISRNMRMGEISVDEGPKERGESPGKHSLLNVNQPLYLGGVPDFTKVNTDSGIRTGLNGVIQKFVVNGLNVDLHLGKQSKFYNVRGSESHACFHKPCENGGSCHPNLGSYKCACPREWQGERCTEPAATLFPLDKNIQREQQESGVYFDGNTKAMYRNSIKQVSRSRSHNSFELHVTTTQPHGLLLVVGKATSSGSNVHDYLALAVSNGRVHLRFNLGSGPAHVYSKERIDDGKLAVIKVERRDRIASVQVNNGLVRRTESPGRTRSLDTDEYLWIGGIDYKPHGIGLYKSFFQSFVGCVKSFSNHDHPINLRDDALNTPTLLTCS